MRMRGTRGRRPFLFSVPLSVSIFTILASAVALVAGALTIYGFMAARSAVRDIGGDLLDSASARILTEIRRAVEPALGYAKLAALLPDIGTLPDLQPHPSSGYLREALKTYPSLYSAYMGFSDGRFYQIIAMDAEQGRAREIHGAPPETAFLQRAVLPRADGRPMELWGFLDADGRLLGSRALPQDAFDPRQRPWYAAAVETDEPVITPVYVFASLGLPGLTVARRFDAAVPGVFGVDLTVGDLSSFLERLRVTPNTRLAVIAGDGTVVAMPGLAVTMAERRKGGILSPALKVGDIADPALAEAARRWTEGKGAGLMEVAGERFLLDVHRIADGGWFDLSVVIATPEADFVKPLVRMRDRSLFFSGLILAAALPIAFFVARRMARALTHMAGDADHIRRLNLDERPEASSFVREIQKLATAMTMMKASLRTFGLYVPKALVGQIIQAGGSVALGGARHEVTLMFTDVTDFTTLAEHTPPEELLTRTSGLFEEIDAAIGRHKGIVDKFIGDAVMAIWNVPQPVDGHARLACLAALEANQRLAVFNADLSAKGLPPMITRFGIHTGIAVVGNVGSSDRMNYTAVGSTVNMAARLEGLNKVFGTRILVSRSTAARAGGDFVFRWLDTVIPKGASEPLDVFALCGLLPKAAAAAGLTGIAPDEIDFVRRWNEAQALLRRSRNWAAAAAAFAELAAARPDDINAAAARETAAGLVGHPVDAWSGVRTMSEK